MVTWGSPSLRNSHLGVPYFQTNPENGEEIEQIHPAFRLKLPLWRFVRVCLIQGTSKKYNIWTSAITARSLPIDPTSHTFLIHPGLRVGHMKSHLHMVLLQDPKFQTRTLAETHRSSSPPGKGSSLMENLRAPNTPGVRLGQLGESTGFYLPLFPPKSSYFWGMEQPHNLCYQHEQLNNPTESSTLRRHSHFGRRTLSRRYWWTPSPPRRLIAAPVRGSTRSRPPRKAWIYIYIYINIIYSYIYNMLYIL